MADFEINKQNTLSQSSRLTEVGGTVKSVKSMVSNANRGLVGIGLGGVVPSLVAIEARLAKLPYMLIIGANEEETGTVSVRKRGEDGDLGSMPTDKFIADITEEIAKKVIS